MASSNGVATMSAGSQVFDAMTLEQVSDAGPSRHDALLARALAGDRNAFSDLVRLHQRSVYSLGLRMLGDRQDAEDLAQEVFLQLHHKLSSVQSGSHLAFWLRKGSPCIAPLTGCAGGERFR